MKIFPAIDIKDKKCVRLIKGDFNSKTEYEMSPVEQAKKYKDHGFINLHIVDLDGALTGRTINIDLIKGLVSKFDLKIEIGGGIRNFESIQKYTDINRDGTKQSPNFEETSKIAEISNCPVIISGGVSSMDDIRKAKSLKNIEGIIVGKAIYDGDIKLEELAKEINA